MKILGIAPLTPAWFEQRRQSITATDVPKILGVSDYGTGLDVWARITGKLSEDELDASDKPWLEWGNRTEQMHREWVGELAGVAVSCSPGLVQHADLPWLMATPDGLYFAGVVDHFPDGDPDLSAVGFQTFQWCGSIETKAPGPWTSFDPQDAPLGFQAQVAVQVACTGLDEAILSSLAWPAPKWARFERDDKLIDDLLNGLTNWHEEHIVKDRMPELGARDLGTIKRLWPKSTGRIIELGAEHQELIDGYVAASDVLALLRQEERDAEAERDSIEARLRAAMGDATYATGGGVIFKCATVDRAGYSVDATRYRTFRTVKEIK